jgi:hypothetical protein
MELLVDQLQVVLQVHLDHLVYLVRVVHQPHQVLLAIQAHLAPQVLVVQLV